MAPGESPHGPKFAPWAEKLLRVRLAAPVKPEETTSGVIAGPTFSPQRSSPLRHAETDVLR